MKAKMKVLFQEGDFDLCKPFTFDVELVRWKSKDYGPHYVLVSAYTTDKQFENQSCLLAAISKWREMVMNHRALNVNDDAEAIREAVAEYDRLKVFIEGFKGGRNVWR